MISPATQSSAQPCDAGGSHYSPPERIQRALRLAHLHEENRKWHEREAALLAWAHNVHPGPGPLPMSQLRELHSCLPDDSTCALGILRKTSPVRPKPGSHSQPREYSLPPSGPTHGSSRSGYLGFGPSAPATSSPAGDSCSSCSLCLTWVLEQRFLAGTRSGGYDGSMTTVDSDSGSGGTPSAQDSLGHYQPLAQRYCSHPGALEPSTGMRGLELREALQQETCAPAPHIHSSQAPVASLVGNCADHFPAPDTCVPGPGPHPFVPGQLFAWFFCQVSAKHACQFQTFIREGVRFSIYYFFQLA